VDWQPNSIHHHIIEPNGIQSTCHHQDNDADGDGRPDDAAEWAGGGGGGGGWGGGGGGPDYVSVIW
jgi:hypothetical protein